MQLQAMSTVTRAQKAIKLRLMDIPDLIAKQRHFFSTYQTFSELFRKEQLLKLENWIIAHEAEIQQALNEDLHKSQAEAFLTETSFCLEEIRYSVKNIKKWMRPTKVRTPLVQQPAKSRIYPEPLGVVLIIGPWNYPFQLIVAPLVAAISAGNCAVLKPSELAPSTSHLLKRMAEELFDPGFVSVVEGQVDVATKLLQEKWDHIFYTGSTKVGQVVMEAAAKHLTPVTLELGGKSPCVIDSECDFDVTVRRIVWGKFMNAGQTCVAPDYVMLPAGFQGKFVEKAREEIERFLGKDPKESPDFSRIISERHYTRLESLVKGAKIAYTGNGDRKEKYFPPTILTEVNWSDAVMQDEIFGPILPVIEYGTLQEVIETINRQPKPLAFYFFSTNKERTQEVLEKCSFGGGCVNDVLVHLANPRLPFGGVGPSGLGAYHGKFGFKTFSHYKSVVHRKFILDLPLRYPPYADKLKLLKKFLG